MSFVFSISSVCARRFHMFLYWTVLTLLRLYSNNYLLPPHRYVSLDGSQLIPGLSPSMDPLEALLGPFPCARVRGIPYEATVEDVLVFFQGLVVIDVVLVSDEESGEAFVVFANPMDFQMGLQR